MRHFNHYLYKFPQSKNYYFRCRFPIELANCFGLKQSHFVASLRTNEINRASWLSLFIRNQFEKELYRLKIVSVDTDFKLFEPDNSGEEQQLDHNWNFLAYLKSRYAVYLKIGKEILAEHRNVDFDLEAVEAISNEDSELYQDYLANRISAEDTSPLLEQIAHKQYPFSYLNDYIAFLKSKDYLKAKSVDDKNLPIAKPTNAEKDFSKYGFGEEYYSNFPNSANQCELESLPLNRFIARHAWIEFEFKRHLVKELKSFESNFNPFEETIEQEVVGPVDLQNFSDLIATLQEVVSVINEHKEDLRKQEADKHALPLRLTCEQFIAEKRRSWKGNGASEKTYNVSFQLLFEYLGEDYDLNSLTGRKAVEIQELVINKDSNRQGGDKSKKLSNKTINKYISNYNSLIDWCITKKKFSEHRSNPFTGLFLPETSETSQERRPYTDQEVQRILNYKPERDARQIPTDSFWFPKIALYTGMRLNEISSLLTEDFKEIDGIHCIDLSTKQKEVKNKNSKRVIPIHSKLIEWGLLKLIDKRREDNQSIVFQESRAGYKEAPRAGWGERPSRWFTRYVIERIGLDKEELKSRGLIADFHCLRHTFCSKARYLGLDNKVMELIAGHGDGFSMTYDHYASKTVTKISIMKDTIERITY